MSREILRAIFKNDFAKLDILLKAGADIKEITEVEKWNYLHRALGSISMSPSLEIIQELIKKGLDVNAIDYYGNAPMHYAARLKRVDLVELLFNADANVNSINKEGVSPLRQLLLSKPYDYNSMKFLVRAGADVNQKNDGGLSIKELAGLVANGDKELLCIFAIG
jgi:ankyrin repeat protein